MLTRRLCLLLVAVTALLAGCSGGDTPEVDRPANLDAVRAVFEDDLAALGLRLTDRGGVLERTTYDTSDTGTHLALYVEPTGAYGEDDYAAGILATASLLGPEIFRRWSALDSFDVCQEPPPGVDDAAEPPPYTQLDITEAVVDDLDWDALTLAELLAVASERAGEGIRLYVDDVVQEAPTFVEARTAAGLPA